MYDQVVESCDCVDEETECSDARVQGEERIQQVLSVAGNTSEQFAIGISAYYYTLMSIHCSFMAVTAQARSQGSFPLSANGAKPFFPLHKSFSYEI